MQMEEVLHPRMQLPMNEKLPLLFSCSDDFPKDATANEWEVTIDLLLWGLDCYSKTYIIGE
jgi:hypothetical protein